MLRQNPRFLEIPAFKRPLPKNPGIREPQDPFLTDPSQLLHTHPAVPKDPRLCAPLECIFILDLRVASVL